MQQPPLLPDETLARVLRVARLDGLTVLVLASVFALMSASGGAAPFAVVGLLGAAAGAFELHGGALLRRGEARGMSWLIASQPFLFAVVIGYCVLRLAYFEVPPIPESLRETVTVSAEQLGMTADEYFRMVNRLTAYIVAAVTAVYQGGMTIYYVRRQPAVWKALASE